MEQPYACVYVLRLWVQARVLHAFKEGTGGGVPSNTHILLLAEYTGIWEIIDEVLSYSW